MLAAAATLTVVLPAATAAAQTVDPRSGLAPGTDSGTTDTGLRADAEQVASNVERLGGAQKPAYSASPGGLSGNNLQSDIAFTGDYAIQGNYSGFAVYDVKDPAEPTLRTAVSCPGSQNDVSVYGDLLFLSVEATSARVDCGAPVAGQPASAVFRGVRIFDISDIDNPVNIAGVQTCKGSHTHTVVTEPGVTDKIWVYVSGTAGVRPATQLAGCNANSSLTDPTTANFRIDVIEVPLATPAAARVVSGPRIMSTCGSSACEGDFASGALNGLSAPGAQPTYPAGSGREPGGQTVAQTSACHDITAYPAIGLAAGACQGDGLLLDISDPVNPKRIDNVTDNNFAYWHSATFNNDGTKVVFTDEWGGGAGARCRPTDPENWGANAIFDIVTTAGGAKEMQFASYYSIPNVQSSNENCVAHNGNLVPVPGRDLMVQAWYQGGFSVFDFTDSSEPTEIGFFDRGPVTTPTSPTSLTLGGFWSTYWNNGSIVGSEIRLGAETFGLRTSDDLSGDERAAARLVRSEQTNVQSQQRTTWAASFPVVGARFDQAVRSGALGRAEGREIGRFIERAERAAARGDAASAEFDLRTKARQLRSPETAGLRAEVLRLADSL